MKLDIRSTGLTFTGYSDSKKATYHVALDFYSEIDPAQSKTHHSDRGVELKLQKKELKEEFWPRLLKDNKKMHFLKTDFDKVGFMYILLLDSTESHCSGLMRMNKTVPPTTT